MASTYFRNKNLHASPYLPFIQPVGLITTVGFLQSFYKLGFPLYILFISALSHFHRELHFRSFMWKFFFLRSMEISAFHHQIFLLASKERSLE
ncbi:hypothetical protein MRB53_004826 [Persea americana]|uniref:Uncharacterized protein n=1 Tax=Persea americana TaxID=3435 RepID=A0ACC2MCC4_PERAE|nr:hypothetical protein MRB53_004826 [Persea americana]